MKNRIAIVLALTASLGLPTGYATSLSEPEAPLTAHGSSHSILGRWTWTRASNHCTEVYDYRPDGTLLATSGAEETTSTYSMSSVPDDHGFYAMRVQLVKSNGAQDCSDGPPNESTEPYTIYVIFSEARPVHLMCETPSLAQCIGPLRKIDP